MPITPEFLTYELNLLEIHKELQENILRDIARRIQKTGVVTDTASWQTERAQHAGILFDEVLSETAKTTGKMRSEIKKLFDDTQTEVFNYDEELLIEAGEDPKVIKNISPAMKQTINAALKKTTTEAINLTKTTAVTSQNLYISACDLAHMQVASGAFTYQQAISNAIKSAARQGVTVVYPSGHISSLDTAVRRSVLTGINQTAGKLQDMRADELGIDLMETTAHMGARPSHAEWQGQIVSRSGRTGYLTLSDIGYGEVTGFMGANCRHSWHMFFEGISKRAYTPEILEEYKNHSVTYNGTEYKDYDAKQIQRRYERSIRQTKQELVMYDEMIKNAENDTDKAQWQQEFESAAVKLKGQEAKLRDFCSQTGFKADNFRTQVFAVKTENGIKNFGKSTSGKAVYKAQEHYDIWRKSIGADDTPKTLANYYKMKYNDKKKYDLLQGYEKAVAKGDISPLIGFKYYCQVATELDEKVIGLSTTDGVTIDSYVPHFIDRIIGQTSEPHSNMRTGVPISDVVDTILHATNISDVRTVIMPNGKIDDRCKYYGNSCEITISITDKRLIQTNPN